MGVNRVAVTLTPRPSKTQGVPPGRVPPSLPRFFPRGQPMSCPRVSIAQFLVFTIMLAVDFALLREFGAWPRHWLDGKLPIVTLIPTLNLIYLGLVMMAGQLRMEGETRPYVTGFVALASANLLVVTTLASLFYGFQWFTAGLYLAYLIVAPIAWLVSSLGYQPRAFPFAAEVALAVLAALAITVPLVAPGLFGGWLFRRFSIRLVKAQTPNRLDPSPTTKSTRPLSERQPAQRP